MEYLNRKDGISASALDAYIRCPKRFFLQYVCAIDKPQGISEEDDPAEVGDIIHAVLRETFMPYKNRPLPAKSQEDLRKDLAQRAASLFENALGNNAGAANLPPQSLFMLRHSGPHKLRTYILGMPDEQSTVLDLEQQRTAAINVGAATRRLCGCIDRIDRREDGLYILDYKTGAINLPAKSLWENSSLWLANFE